MLLGLIGAALAGDVRVDMLDVGQGDSILIRTPANKVILIDAAESGGDVAEQLKREGVDHLDLVIATHPHADHIGGMKAVLETFPVKRYTDNGMPHTTQTYAGVMTEIEARGISYQAAVRGTVFNLDDGAKLEILFPTSSPLTGTRSDLNANSVVARLTHGSDCFLFVGDAEQPTEAALLSAGGLGQCDVLKVAHHGSQYSSTQAFLDVVQPEVALISAGVANRYRHPGPDTVERIRAMGTAIYRTDESGQITLTSTGHGVKVTTTHPPVAVLSTPAPWYPPGTEPATAPTGTLRAPETLRPGQAPTLSTSTKPATPAPTSTSSSASAPAATAPTATAPTATAPTATGAPAASAAPRADCPYIASVNSEVFHEAGCGNGEKILPANQVCYATREAALAAGRRPAGCCKP